MKRGDALVLIGRRFGVSVAQIKQANGLTSDLIRAGQTLRIPPAPRATATPEPKSAPTAAKGKSPGSPTEAELKHVRLQVFLDREQFSSGPITGKPNPAFGKVLYLYQSTHDDAKDDAALEEKARTAVGDVFVRYKLRAEDFRFISPPKAETAGPVPVPTPGASVFAIAAFQIFRHHQAGAKLRGADREFDVGLSEPVGFRRRALSLQ